jgi:hypothetical protein
MPAKLEYHHSVQRSFTAPVALFGLITAYLLLTTVVQAQINAAPTSVTSPGFGGRAVNGTPSSVTSLGPRGYTPGPRVSFSAPRPQSRDGHHRRRNFVDSAPAVAYAVPVPYAVDMGAPEDDAGDPDADYQGGPTIFDRRGSGADSYVPPVRDFSRPHALTEAESAPSVPDPPQEPTLLIFKDGHKLEVSNYAIIGEILFDLTPGHSRRIALANLDLDETRRQNDDHGVIFQLPPTSQAN